MRIYFNRRPVSGPWGGGSKILSAVMDEASRRGHEILHAGTAREVDKIDAVDRVFIMDPRDTADLQLSRVFDLGKRSRCPIIQRVGDVGTHGKPELTVAVEDTLKKVDVAIFPSLWAKTYVRSPQSLKTFIIPNQPIPQFVGRSRERTWMQDGVLRVVTHHWSDNDAKGHDVYEAFTQALSRRKIDIDFTFIGRHPRDVHLQRVVPPLDVEGLLKELPRHDVYLTASRLEAGANHVLEAMALGLPVLYRGSGGSIVEYCSGMGLEYRDIDHLMHRLEWDRTQLEQLSLEMTGHDGRLRWKTSTVDLGRRYVDLIEAASS